MPGNDQTRGVADADRTPSLRVAGLFAGIGGLELGLSRPGHEAVLLCELDPVASRVLAEQFPRVALHGDVRTLEGLGGANVVTAGFPCQDLSQAGRTRGIEGARSGLVSEVFRLIDGAAGSVKWVVLENVPFMLRLERGRAMGYLTSEFESRGFRWAYRTVDTQWFGLPQRRKRIVLVASKDHDPATVLFADETVETPRMWASDTACGFYWTEGNTGLGWAVDAVPPLKGGSALGIASPPAVWLPDGLVGVPTVEDGERLQGFPRGWTASVEGPPSRRKGWRWRLVGNAVSVPVAEWIGQRLARPGSVVCAMGAPICEHDAWPAAAVGDREGRYRMEASAAPIDVAYRPLAAFLSDPIIPLSARAATGFASRARRSTLRIPEGLIAAVESGIPTGTSGSELAASVPNDG